VREGKGLVPAGEEGGGKGGCASARTLQPGRTITHRGKGEQGKELTSDKAWLFIDEEGGVGDVIRKRGGKKKRPPLNYKAFKTIRGGRGEGKLSVIGGVLSLSTVKREGREKEGKTRLHSSNSCAQERVGSYCSMGRPILGKGGGRVKRGG